MGSTPTVRRMVMFKHGVAYLERGGPADGPFELSFKKDEMNDVLKSLAVWVAKGDAKVGAVAFEKPEDPEEALVRRKLNLPNWGTLLALVGTLKGRRVAIEVKGTRHEGEVVGVEGEDGGDSGNTKRIVLRTSEGKISFFDLSVADSIELLEPSSRADLAFFVDRSRAASSGENRTIHVSVSGRAEDLRVSYVVPAPTWRVSYRLARSAEETMMMAWGIVHNPADEDLEDLDLTLTTGQPVSFVIDLYNPKSVRRVVVEEQSRALAAAPTRFERAPQMRRPAPGAITMSAPAMPAPAARMSMAGFAARDDAPDTPVEDYGVASMSEGMEGAAEYSDRGELFEYRVASKISLKRGGSAMVPLLASKLDAKKERIWRDGSGPSPDLVMTFKNTTNAVLEEGPAVIYDESVYAGEAMVPYSARGSEVKLAFAKDLGVRCKRAAKSLTRLNAVRLEDQALVEELRREEHHELSAENDHAEEVLVVFELPKTHGRTFDPEREQPFEDTASYHRFKTVVPPHGRATLTVVERWHDSQRVEYGRIGHQQLARWLSDRFLDKSTFDALSEVLATWNEAVGYDQKCRQVEREQQEAYAKQSKLSEQLRVLREGGPEGALRLRYVKELEAEQDKVNASEADMRRHTAAAADARKKAADKLEKLTLTAK